MGSMVKLYLAGVLCQVSIRPSFKTTVLWLIRSRVHHVPAQSDFLWKTATYYSPGSIASMTLRASSVVFVIIKSFRIAEAPFIPRT